MKPTEPVHELRILRSRYLRGPNIWTYRPVLESWLDLGSLEDFPSNLLPGFNQRLTSWLPGLTEHHCGVGERGGFLQRLESGTWAGHVLEHVVIELQNLAGLATAFGQTRSTSQRGVYRMVFRARNEKVALAALATGHALLMAAIHDKPFDLDSAVEALRDQVESHFLGPSTACIVDAAIERRIPHNRLNDGNLVQLGMGARQRRIWTAESDRTSAIAESIASDKDLTKRLLQSCGVPVPEGQVVASAEEAWEAAEDIGLPVAVKPSDANHGRGVSLDLKTREEIEAAFHLADKEGSEVMVERFIRGNEHRLLVVGGKVVAASRGEFSWVTGDGRSTVLQLIDSQLNSDPRRGENEAFPLNHITMEEEKAIPLELARQGLSPEAVPEAGRRVLIQRNGNLSIDCTDLVHPEVEHAVTLAARIVGLDIAGVDLVTEDVSRPLEQTGGAIVEVNAGPGLLMHLKPAVGQPRPVGRAIIDHLFPDEENGRIPVVGVAGSVGTATIARLIAWLVHLSGCKTGLACADGLFVDRRRVEAKPAAHWEPASRLLMNRAVEAAVIENGALTILEEGLAYDRCLVGVVTDMGLGSDGGLALAKHDVFGPDDLYKVLRTQVDVVLPEGAAVLSAANARLVEMAELCDGEVIFYALNGELEAMLSHRAEGGRVVFVRQGRIVLARGKEELQLAAGTATAALTPQLLLAAVAAAWALDISPALITAGIKSFDPVAAATRVA